MKIAITRGPGSSHAVQEAAQSARAVSSLGSFAVSSDKMGKLVRHVREALRSLTPVEAVEILMLILWPVFLLIAFRACG